MYSAPKATDLLDNLIHNSREEVKTFERVCDDNSFWKRQLIINEIDVLTSNTIESFIRFYNQVDEEAGLAIEEREPIKIFIDSPGGDLCAAFTIIDTIKMSKTPVWTINIGCAYSGGFFIFIAGHKRFAYPQSSFLYHEGSTVTGGDAGKFRNFADFYNKQLNMLKNITLSHTKITEDLYEQHKKDDWWMTTEEAIELGVCDKIVEEFII